MTLFKHRKDMHRYEPIRWVSDEYGYQPIYIADCDYNNTTLKLERPKVSMNKGYVKVWWKGPDGLQVIDRALTVTRARKIIRNHRNSPLFR